MLAPLCEVMNMFEKNHIDALFDELKLDWKDKPEFEKLSRDAHLGIALSDAGRPVGKGVDPRVVTLIEKHKPKG